MKILAAVYSHPEYYPPTLNAINLLAKSFDDVILISRNVKPQETFFPENVRLKVSGKYKPIRETEKQNLFLKVLSFIEFTLLFFKIIKLEKPDWVICYDPIPLLSFRIASHFLKKKTKLWYHNHDVLELKNTRPLSIGYFATKNEKIYFNKIDLFSLPAQERKSHFPLHNFNGNYFFIPNYPSLSHFSLNNTQRSIVEKKQINFIFQGSIGPNHGLEEIIRLIPKLKEKFSKNFGLVLKGFISEDYRKEILREAEKNNASKYINIFGVGPYEEVYKLSAKMDIGLAIHTKNDFMNQTLGTSSNKIYEYIAVGLPVILFNNEHFKAHLINKKWAFFTDLSESSLINITESILNSYREISRSSISDFENNLNFEFHFQKVINFLKSN